MVAAYNTYLRNTINLVNNQRINAIKDGGLDSFNSMREFEDEDFKLISSSFSDCVIDCLLHCCRNQLVASVCA